MSLRRWLRWAFAIPALALIFGLAAAVASFVPGFVVLPTSAHGLSLADYSTNPNRTIAPLSPRVVQDALHDALVYPTAPAFSATPPTSSPTPQPSSGSPSPVPTPSAIVPLPTPTPIVPIPTPTPILPVPTPTPILPLPSVLPLPSILPLPTPPIFG